MIEWNRLSHGAEYSGYTDIVNNRYMVFEITPNEIPSMGRWYRLFSYTVVVDDDGEIADSWKEFPRAFRRIKEAKAHAEWLDETRR